jgi:hypothetical protein
MPRQASSSQAGVGGGPAAADGGTGEGQGRNEAAGGLGSLAEPTVVQPVVTPRNVPEEQGLGEWVPAGQHRSTGEAEGWWPGYSQAVGGGPDQLNGPVGYEQALGAEQSAAGQSGAGRFGYQQDGWHPAQGLGQQPGEPAQGLGQQAWVPAQRSPAETGHSDAAGESGYGGGPRTVGYGGGPGMVGYAGGPGGMGHSGGPGGMGHSGGPGGMGYGGGSEGMGYGGGLGGMPAQRSSGGGDGSAAYRRKGLGLFAAVAAVLAAVIAVAALVFVLANRPEEPARDPNVPTVAGSPPTDVRLRDEGSEIEVSWQDPTTGTVSFMVAMARQGAQLRPVTTLGPGQTSFRMSALNVGLNYCFAVIAVYGADKLSPSPQVCTSRTSGSSTPK